MEIYQFMLIINAVVGLVVFEQAYYRLRRFRNPNKDLDALYPAYRREDAAKWQKWRLYPGALTILLPRLFLSGLILLNCVLWLSVFMVGHKKDMPITGCRKRALKLVYKFTVHAIALVGFFCTVHNRSMTMEDVDHYQEYLGTPEEQRKCQENPVDDIRVPKRGPGKASVIVSNHTGYLDIFSLICSPVHPGFTARAANREVPVLNKLTEGLGSLYISRGGTIEERNAIVETIIERQRMIEDREIEYQPLALFAEATTCNSKVLLPFKRGAFQGMRTVIPSYTTYTHGMISPHYDTVDFAPLVLLLMSSCQINSVTLHIMPEFTPNTHMLEKHADKGQQPWEIFAWCVRDTISKKSGRPKENNSTLKDKFAYIEFMHGDKDYMEVKDRLFKIGGTYDSTNFKKIKTPEAPQSEEAV